MKHHIHEWIKVIVASLPVEASSRGSRFCPSDSLFQALSYLQHADTVQELCRVLAFQASSTKEIN